MKRLDEDAEWRWLHRVGAVLVWLVVVGLIVLGWFWGFWRKS
jgi:hypothetical protein